MPPKSRPKAKPKTTPKSRPKTTAKTRPKTTPKSRPKTTPKSRPKNQSKTKRSNVNVNWAEKLGITAPQDLGPLISRNLKPVFQVPPPVGNDRPNEPTLNESWEKAVKKGLRIVKQENDWIEVRIPIEIRSLIPDMPTRMRLYPTYFDHVKIVNETPEIFAPLPTPPGYVRKMKQYLDFWYGADGLVERNKMTNLQTFRQNRSGRISDMVQPGNVRFENMDYFEYHHPGVLSRLDMEEQKRILRDGLLRVGIYKTDYKEDHRIDISNKYFESGRGFHLQLTLIPSEYVIVSAQIISKKQLRPEPRAPSTRPRKRRRNV